MPDPVFHSKLGADIEAFIIQKRAAGYPYLTSAMVLGYLDIMITETFPESGMLSKEICDAWIGGMLKTAPEHLIEESDTSSAAWEISCRNWKTRIHYSGRYSA